MTAKNFDDLAAPLYSTEEGQALIEECRQEHRAEVFAYRIGELRRELGIDQAELAERLGMSQAGVSKLERSTDPKLSTLMKLAAALGASLHIEITAQDHTIALDQTPLIHPGFCAGSNDWSKYGDYETRYAAWADFAEVFAGAEGARGADGVGVA